jgi:hypothetical protein
MNDKDILLETAIQLFLNLDSSLRTEVVDFLKSSLPYPDPRQKPAERDE